MADDRTKNLIIRFTTDALPAQRDIQGFAQVSGAALLQLGAQAGKSSDSLGDLANKADTLKHFTSSIPLLGTLVGKALDLVSTSAREAEQDIAHLVKIADDAGRAGVGTTFFQAYTAQAQALRVETKTLVDELNKAADAGKVSIATAGDDDSGKSEALKTLEKTVAAGNLGKGAVTSFTGAEDGEARIKVMLDLLDQLQQKNAKLAEFDLAKSFFGDSFEQRLRAGVDAIGDMRSKMEDLQTSGGVQIVAAEQITRAKQMQEEINQLNDRLAAVTLPTAQKVEGVFHNWDEVLTAGDAVIYKYIEDLVDWINKWVGAGNAITAIKTKLLDLANYMRGLAHLPPLKVTAEGDTDAADRTGDKEAAARRALANAMGGAPLPPEKPGAAKPDLSPYGDLTASRTAIRGAPDDLTVRPKADTSLHYLAKDKSGGDSDANDKVQNYIDSLKKAQQEEEAQAAALGKSNLERQEAIALAHGQALADDENRTLTKAETDEIKRRTDATEAAKEKIEAFTRAQTQAKEQAEFFGQTFEQAIEGIVVQANSLADVLKSVLQALEAAALKAIILGDGPLAGLFGTAAPINATGSAAVGGLFGSALKGFSGLFADGGPIGAGQWGIAGEKGPEIIMGPSTVVPTFPVPAAAALAGGKATTSVTHAPTYNIMPAQGVTPGQLAAVLDRHDKAFNRTLGDRMSGWSRRYG